jgi:thiol-disulfide isomerase/thioredoxin
MKRKYSIFVLIVLMLVASWLYLRAGDTTYDANGNGGGKLPQSSNALALTLMDGDGSEVALGDYLGTPLVLNSWAVWCPFCKAELTDFVTVQEEFRKAVTIIAINRKEAIEKQEEFLNSVGIVDELVFLNDEKDSFYRTIGGLGMPETLFIDSGGQVVYHKRGPMDLEEIRERVARLVQQ